MRFTDGALCDFGAKRDVILRIIEDGTAFQTSGCPECNRPMANETFSMIYNFPRKLKDDEVASVKKELRLGWC